MKTKIKTLWVLMSVSCDSAVYLRINHSLSVLYPVEHAHSTARYNMLNSITPPDAIILQFAALVSQAVYSTDVPHSLQTVALLIT